LYDEGGKIVMFALALPGAPFFGSG
jgi:hypothetical protein